MQSLSITISHNIFLTREQRYALQYINQTIETTGVSVPVWMLDGNSQEPADEIFCKYSIKLDLGEPEKIKHVSPLENGYEILLSSKMAQRLTDFRDTGCECVMFAYHDMMVLEAKLVPSIHYVGIYDLDILMQSLRE